NEGAHHEDDEDHREEARGVLEPPGLAQRVLANPLALRAQALLARPLAHLGRALGIECLQRRPCGPFAFGPEPPPVGNPGNEGNDEQQEQDQGEVHQRSSTWSTARNASCGISTDPTCFIRFLPAFCFSSSFFWRVSPPP